MYVISLPSDKIYSSTMKKFGDNNYKFHEIVKKKRPKRYKRAKMALKRSPE